MAGQLREPETKNLAHRGRTGWADPSASALLRGHTPKRHPLVPDTLWRKAWHPGDQALGSCKASCDASLLWPNVRRPKDFSDGRTDRRRASAVIGTYLLCLRQGPWTHLAAFSRRVSSALTFLVFRTTPALKAPLTWFQWECLRSPDSARLCRSAPVSLE